MASDHQHNIAVLRRSHDDLVTLVTALPDGGVREPSYCAEWTIAQALSHIGSGAEISQLRFEHALAGSPPPEQAQYVEIWDRWNALEPEEMASGAILSDQQFVARLENATEAELDGFSMEWYGGQTLDAAAMVANRLNEHAFHTWDIAVMGDSDATLMPAAVEILADAIPTRIVGLARGERPSLAPTSVGVVVADHPEYSRTIAIGEEVIAEPASDAPTTLEIPAEALLRLTFGRMDSGHTPASVTISGALTLDDLRALYPGF